jgi:2-dehydropantoate 2-reductase
VRRSFQRLSEVSAAALTVLWQTPPMATRASRIVIAGAGNIGCYVGGCLALAGRDVVLLLRPALCEAVSRYGLRLSDLDGRDRSLAAGMLQATVDPVEALRAAHIVLVTVKSGATDEMAGLIASHASADAVVVSLQNGVGNVEALRTRGGVSRQVIPGMVPFNVVRSSDGGAVPRFHRATSGTMLIGAGVPGLRDAIDVPGAPVAEHSDMAGVLWGKLVLNLNNAINALAGIPLAEELADRRWRGLLADQISEALAVMRRAGVRPAAIEGVPLRAIPLILRLPDLLFGLVARRLLAVDPQARSSMWEDLMRGRVTEIDYLQGAILSLADKSRSPAPVTRRIASRIKAAESARAGSPGLTPEDVSEL